MIDINLLRKLFAEDKVFVTEHAAERFRQRGIRMKDIRTVVGNGEIIEDYPEDYPFPSCLILGKSGEVNIHIVASINDDMIYLITAYIPNPDKWEDDFKTRKEELK